MSDINGSKPTNFPLDESKLDFKIPRTDAPRENVLKLGSMITNRIGLKATADDPEYWGLAGVMTDEMVDVALKMGVRKPKTTEQLMKLTKMEREPLEKLLTEMAWTGIIEYNWENLDGKNPKHEKRWVLPLFVPGVLVPGCLPQPTASISPASIHRHAAAAVRRWAIRTVCFFIIDPTFLSLVSSAKRPGVPGGVISAADKARRCGAP